jgi:hypothetical protein
MSERIGLAKTGQHRRGCLLVITCTLGCWISHHGPQANVMALFLYPQVTCKSQYENIRPCRIPCPIESFQVGLLDYIYMYMTHCIGEVQIHQFLGKCAERLQEGAPSQDSSSSNSNLTLNHHRYHRLHLQEKGHENSNIPNQDSTHHQQSHHSACYASSTAQQCAV